MLTFARSRAGGHASIRLVQTRWLARGAVKASTAPAPDDGRDHHRGPKDVSRNRVFTATSAVKAVTTAR